MRRDGKMKTKHPEKKEVFIYSHLPRSSQINAVAFPWHKWQIAAGDIERKCRQILTHSQAVISSLRYPIGFTNVIPFAIFVSFLWFPFPSCIQSSKYQTGRFYHDLVRLDTQLLRALRLENWQESFLTLSVCRNLSISNICQKLLSLWLCILA